MDCPICLDPKYVNRVVNLPYGLIVDEVDEAVRKTYRFFHGLNSHLADSGFRTLEEMLLGNTLSGMISEVVIKHLSESSKALVKNERTGGHPDLLPTGHYDSANVLRGSEGIEVKASINSGSWQGHNPEACWLVVFRYLVGKKSFRFTEILCAELEEEDWTFSGRNENSRRTPTASINKFGVSRLRANYLYRLPGYGVGAHKHILANDTGLRDGSTD